MGVYTNLWNNMSMRVTMGIMEFHMGVNGSLCASMGVYGRVWMFMGVWINMNSGWVYLYVVYRWYVCVFKGICEFVRVYGTL